MSGVIWEQCKENIQPLSQGRKIDDLMQSLPLVNDDKSRKELLKSRKEQFDTDLKATRDDADKQLDIWHDYIEWLEQNVPNGGKENGIINVIEKCIELYHDKNNFKQDKRLFNIFMKFKRFCDEPTEVFGFMYANSICSLLARFYLNWSWQYEINKNMKRAEDIIKLGLKNLATPRDVLLEAESQIKCRIVRMIRSGELDDCPPDLGAPINDQLAAGSDIRAALQTLKFKITKKKRAVVPVNRVGSAVERSNLGGLSSQTKIVNGVRVAAKAQPATKTTISRPKSNAPIQVFVDKDDDEEPSSGSGAPTRPFVSATTTNPSTSGYSGPLADLMPKIPTSQKIGIVGKTGAENQPPKMGALRKLQ